MPAAYLSPLSFVSFLYKSNHDYSAIQHSVVNVTWMLTIPVLSMPRISATHLQDTGSKVDQCETCR